jgi:hypothetical protein
MAWVYLTKFSNEELFDVRSCNEQLQQLCGASVDLGEESWADGWLLPADLEPDVAVRYWLETYINPSIANGSGKLLVPADTWMAIDPLTQISSTTRGGMIWVRASVGLKNPVTLTNLPTGIELAIEVNGVIYQDGGIGAPDVNAETLKGIAGVNVTPSATGVEIALTKDQYGPGIRAYHDMPIIGCVAHVQAGPLNVRVVYRNVAPPTNEAVQRLTALTLVALEVGREA